MTATLPPPIPPIVVPSIPTPPPVTPPGVIPPPPPPPAEPTIVQQSGLLPLQSVFAPVPQPPAQPAPPPAQPLAAPPPTPAPAALRLSKLTIEPGDNVVATGQGCVPGAPVTLTIAGRLVGTTTADAGGNFRTPINASHLEIGRHTVTAVCGRTLQASLDVVLGSAVDPGGSEAILLIFVVLLGAGLFRRQLLQGRRVP